MEDMVLGCNSLNCALSLPVQTKSLFAQSKLEAYEKEMQIISPMGGLSQKDDHKELWNLSGKATQRELLGAVKT